MPGLMEVFNLPLQASEQAFGIRLDLEAQRQLMQQLVGLQHGGGIDAAYLPFGIGQTLQIGQQRALAYTAVAANQKDAVAVADQVPDQIEALVEFGGRVETGASALGDHSAPPGNPSVNPVLVCIHPGFLSVWPGRRHRLPGRFPARRAAPV